MSDCNSESYRYRLGKHAADCYTLSRSTYDYYFPHQRVILFHVSKINLSCYLETSNVFFNKPFDIHPDREDQQAVQDMSHIDSITDESNKRIERVIVACVQCRSRHVKCDATQPICNRCKKDDKECVYTKSRRGGLDKAALARRRARLQQEAEEASTSEDIALLDTYDCSSKIDTVAVVRSKPVPQERLLESSLRISGLLSLLCCRCTIYRLDD
jgi:hypothetical protein